MRAQSAIDAEAAMWLARVQRGLGSPEQERALADWLEEDGRHRAAFGRACEIWDLIPGSLEPALLDRGPEPLGVIAPPKARVARRVAAMAMLALLFLTAAPISGLRGDRYETGTGEQRMVRLADGTRVTLNTNSAIAVDYDSGQRSVRLERGEALFEVSKDPARPFVVQHRQERVRALGTTFVVRDGREQTAVTLIEGRVEVSHKPRGGTGAARRIAILTPGERITLTAKAGAVVDHPALNIVTAWQKGEVMFDDTRLIDAAAEFNRYVDDREIVTDPSVASVRLSGVFATRDPMQFAETVALLHQLNVEIRGNEIHLSR